MPPPALRPLLTPCLRSLALLASLALVALHATAQAPLAHVQATPARAVAEVPVTLLTRLGDEAVRLAPWRGSVAALSAAGRLSRVPPPGGVASTLATGLEPDVLIACNGRLVAVDGRQRLVTVPASGRPLAAAALHATPTCLPDGGLLLVRSDGGALLRFAPDMSVAAVAELPLLPDAEPTLASDGSVLVLADPTLRYRHGVLGDEVEAGALLRLDPQTLAVLNRFVVPPERVIEDRRSVASDLFGAPGAVFTVSGPTGGGALWFVAPTADGLVLRAVAPNLGAPERWRHLIGVGRHGAYAVARPHHGAALERFAPLAAAASGAGVPAVGRRTFGIALASHQLGTRALDRAQLLASDGPWDLLVAPAAGEDAVLFVACDAEACWVWARVALPAALSAPPLVERSGDGYTAYLADRSGAVWRAAVPAPHDRIPSDAM